MILRMRPFPFPVPVVCRSDFQCPLAVHSSCPPSFAQSSSREVKDGYWQKDGKTTDHDQGYRISTHISCLPSFLYPASSAQTTLTNRAEQNRSEGNPPETRSHTHKQSPHRPSPSSSPNQNPAVPSPSPYPLTSPARPRRKGRRAWGPRCQLPGVRSNVERMEGGERVGELREVEMGRRVGKRRALQNRVGRIWTWG